MLCFMQHGNSKTLTNTSPQWGNFRCCFQHSITLLPNITAEIPQFVVKCNRLVLKPLAQHQSWCAFRIVVQQLQCDFLPAHIWDRFLSPGITCVCVLNFFFLCSNVPEISPCSQTQRFSSKQRHSLVPFVDVMTDCDLRLFRNVGNVFTLRWHAEFCEVEEWVLIRLAKLLHAFK